MYSHIVKYFMFVLLISCISSRAKAEQQHVAINEGMFVRIGGIEQWIQINGSDSNNPVLLWLNGGPGCSTVLDAPVFQAWQRYFTVVMWDQRGEGKTFQKNGSSDAESMTIERMASDGSELAQFLAQHLHKRKIILLGHSWGSVLGIRMIANNPALFSAYVGTGQVTQLKRQLEAAYPLLLKLAKAVRTTNPEAAMELSALGSPPWQSNKAYEIVDKWTGAFSPPAAPPTQEDIDTWMRLPELEEPNYIAEGMDFSNKMLAEALSEEDLPAFAKSFSVPVFFIQGKEDLLTLTSAVRDYFNQITAASKHFIELPAAGHNAIFSHRAQFLEQLITQVRPVAMSND